MSLALPRAPAPQVDEMMRQELQRLRLAVDREETRPLKAKKSSKVGAVWGDRGVLVLGMRGWDQGHGWGLCRGGGTGPSSCPDCTGFPFTSFFQAEVGEEKWEKGEGPDPGQVSPS